MARRGNGYIHKPARGGGCNGPGQGDGWGGPARGSGHGSERGVFNCETSRAAVAKQHANREAGLMSKADIRRQRTEELEAILYRLAVGAEREETQISAAVKLHAIYNGQPVARNLNVQVDDVSQLTDDELRAELARTGGTPPAPDEGDTAAGVSHQLPGVLH
jgi:hypothetical protein